jgi:hypothetical protein
VRASRPFLTIADRILGARFLQDIAEFFVLLQSMEKGFVSRARSVRQLMGDARTTVLRRHDAGDRAGPRGRLLRGRAAAAQAAARRA